MQIEEHVMRRAADTVELKDVAEGETMTVEAVHRRQRTGAGPVSGDIVVSLKPRYGNGVEILRLTSDLADYRQSARDLAALLLRVADAPCDLPGESPQATLPGAEG